MTRFALCFVVGMAACAPAPEHSSTDIDNGNTRELLCGDLIDNDDDGAIDCWDVDCAHAANCNGSPAVESGALCFDGVDNDDDGRTDCADPKCADHPACGPEGGTGTCADGVDNDSDGLTDCADEDCAAFWPCAADGFLENTEETIAEPDHVNPEAAPGGSDTSIDETDEDETPEDETPEDETPEDETTEDEPAVVDFDGDGLLDNEEIQLGTDPSLADTDGDGLADLEEVGDIYAPFDTDEDGRIDAIESMLVDCDGDTKNDQDDSVDLTLPSDDRDADGIPNAADVDDDNDGICDPGIEEGTESCVYIDGEADRCPWVYDIGSNPDSDGDSNGDACDLDRDGDGIVNAIDICPWDYDPEQYDSDGDGVGEACDSFRAPLPCEASTELACELIVEEVLYNVTTAGGAAPVDANGDGIADSSDDEFVEIRNISSTDLDLSGIAIHDAHTFEAGGAQARHVFDDGTLLRRGQRLVVFGGGAPSFDGSLAGIVAVSSSGSLGLNNGGDTIRLVSADGVVLDALSFGNASGLSSSANRSLTRYPEGNRGEDAWMDHPPRTYDDDVHVISPGRCPEN